MKTALYMAPTPNGYIARPNGSEDFSAHKNWETTVKLVKEYGNITIGHNTYIELLNWGSEYDLTKLDNTTLVVVSSNTKFQPVKGYNKVTSPEAAVEFLKKYP